MMKRKSRFGQLYAAGLVSLLLVLVAGVAYASAIVVDDFDEGEQYVCAGNGCSPLWSSASAFDVATVLGGERDLVVARASGNGSVSIAVDAGDSDYLAYSEDAGTQGTGDIYWDGNDDDATTLNPTGLAGIDLTTAGVSSGIKLDVVSADAGFDLQIVIYSDANNASMATLAISSAVAPPGRTFYIPFSQFRQLSGATGPVDFTDVGAIHFGIRSNQANTDLILDTIEVVPNTDWGDLPAPYQTTEAENGPRHIGGSLFLGRQIDREPDGQPDILALGDDSDETGVDDEDGIERPADSWRPGNTVELTARVRGSGGYLVGWFDWDGDGTMEATEQVDFGPTASGLNTLSLTIPASYGTGTTLYARFRLYQGQPAEPQPIGQVQNGEVEDYFWEFTPTAVDLATVAAGPGANVPLMVLILVGAALTLAVVLYRRRRFSR